MPSFAVVAALVAGPLLAGTIPTPEPCLGLKVEAPAVTASGEPAAIEFIFTNRCPRRIVVLDPLWPNVSLVGCEIRDSSGSPAHGDFECRLTHPPPLTALEAMKYQRALNPGRSFRRAIPLESFRFLEAPSLAPGRYTLDCSYGAPYDALFDPTPLAPAMWYGEVRAARIGLKVVRPRR